MHKRILNSKNKMFFYIVLGLLLWILTGYILYPALKTVWLSLTDEAGLTLNTYIKIFTTESYVAALKNSIILGLLTVLICGSIGTALAFFVHFFDLPYKKLIDKLLLLPLVLPGLIIVFAFVQLYGESGLITKSLELIFNLSKSPYRFSGLKGILFVHAYTQYVYYYMNVSVALKHLDQNVIDASRNLGASKLKIFTSIILPVITPALIASSIITFMTGIGSFSAPNIIGGSFKVLTTQILLAKANNFMSIAAAQVVILTIVCIVYLALARFYERKKQFTSSVKATPISPIVIKNPLLKTLILVITISLVILITLPIATIVLLSFVKPGTWMIDIFPKKFSFDNYLRIFSKSRSFTPFFNSFTMASITALLCSVIALPASYIIVKTKSKAKFWVEFLVMLPLTMPASAIAINTINAFNKPTIFTFNKVLVGLYILLPIAYTVSLLPLMVRSTVVSLQNLNDSFIEASKNLGASKFQTFWHIIIPAISPGVIAGLLLIFIRSLGEYTISAFIYNASNKPISIAMANAVFDYNIGLAMAYGALIIVITIIGSTIIRKISVTN